MTIALLTLSSLSAVIYHDDAIAGKDNSGGDRGGSSGGSGSSGQSGGDSKSADHSDSGNKPDPSFGSISDRKSYYKWLSELLRD